MGDDCWLSSTEGETRLRYIDEWNSRLSGRDNPAGLTRLRVFTDLWYQDRASLFVGFLDARYYNGSLPPGPGLSSQLLYAQHTFRC